MFPVFYRLQRTNRSLVQTILQIFSFFLIFPFVIEILSNPTKKN